MDPGDARRGDLAHQQPRRVLLTCSQALPDVGGVAVVVDREIRALAAAGHQVTLVTSHYAGSSAAPEYPDSVRIVRIGSSAVLRRLGLGGPVFSWRLIPALWRELGRCDVLHAHEFLALNSVLALRLARLRRRPSILTEHAGIQRRQARVGNWLAQLAYQTLGRMSVRAAGRCVVVSARVADDLRRLAQPGKRIDFVPVAIDRQLFRPPAPGERQQARARLGWPPDRRKVLFVGRLVAEKGIASVLAAVDPAYDIVFCGPGDRAILGPARRASNICRRGRSANWSSCTTRPMRWFWRRTARGFRWSCARRWPADCPPCWPMNRVSSLTADCRC